MDDEDGQILRQIAASLMTPSDAEKEALLPYYIGDRTTSTQPHARGITMVASASAALFPQFIGDCSIQQPPPTLGGTMDESAAAAAAAFAHYNGNGEGSSALPPMVSGGCLPAGLSSMDMETTPFVPFDALPNPFDHGLITPGGEVSLSPEVLYQVLMDYLDKQAGQSMPAGAGIMEGNNQWRLPPDGVAPPASLQQRFMMNSAAMIPWQSEFDADSLLGTNQTTIDDNVAPAVDQAHTMEFDSAAGGTHQVPVQEIPYSNTLPADVPLVQVQHMVDNEAMEMAELYRVASECDGEESMVWSPDEDKLLLDGLSRLANQDMVSMCMEIAYGLPKKTSMDVASRIQWFQSKNKSADAQAIVGSKESAGGKTRKAQAGVSSKESAGRKTGKGKGIEDPNMKRNKHAPSKKTPDYKDIKALIRENTKLMDRIDDNLETGQLANLPSMFDNSKTTIDAILMKMRKMDFSTDEFKIDLEALEEVKRGFHPPSEN